MHNPADFLSTKIKLLPKHQAYIFALVLVIAGTLIRWELPAVFQTTPFLTFYPAVVLAAALGGFGPGIFTSVAFCAAYFIDPSREPISTVGVPELVRVVVFMSSGLMISLISEAQIRSRTRQLKQSQELQSLTILTNLGPFMIRDQQDRIIHWSEGCARLYGFSSDRALGSISHELLKTVFSMPLEQINEQLRKNGRWEGELTHIRNDGSTIVVSSLWVLRNHVSGPVILEVDSDITRLKEVKESLRLNEEQLRLATMAAEIGVWSWRPGTNEVVVSANWRRLFAVDPAAEVTFETWRDRLHPEDRGRAVAELIAAQKEHREFNTEYRVIRPDGSILWLVDRGRGTYDESGHAMRMAGINLDITERKRAEERLSESEQRIRAAFDNAGVGIVEVDRDDDRFIAANSRACEILKRSSEDLLGMNVHELTWPEDRSLSDRMNLELHEGVQDRIEYEKRYIRGDGSPVWAHVNISAIKDIEGRWVRSVTTIEDISDRKKAENALRDSEFFYRQTLESIPGMVFTTRADGYCDYQSQQWVEYTGVPMSEHLGDGWNRLLHPDDRARAYSAWQSAVEERAPYDLEYRVRRRDGTYEWFKVIGRPIRDAGGQIVRWFGVAINIEDIKRAEAVLRESEDRYRGIVQASAAAVWTAQPDGSIIADSPSWRAFTGQTKEEFLGYGWINTVHPDDRAQTDVAWRTAVDRADIYRTEYRLWHARSGRYRNTLASGVRILNEDGSTREWVGMNIDVTELREAEEALRQAKEEAQNRAREVEDRERILTAMMEHIPLGITIADAPDVRIRMVSRYGREITGKPREQIEHIPVNLHAERWQIFRSDGSTPATNEELPLTRATQKGEVVQGEELVIERPDGTKIPILCTAAPIRDAGGNITGGVIGWQDITQRKLTMEELKQAKDSAERAKAAAENANRAKDHFLAVLSHELRTPLTPVVMGISMLQDKPDLDTTSRETLEMVRQNIEMEARLIDDLLDVTRIARGKIELNRSRVAICKIIQRAAEVCKPDIEARKLHFGVDIGPSAPYWVDADASRLQQVFWNLLKNAIKFTPHGGCVGVRCRPGEKHVLIEVNDSGIGIEPHMIPRIFDAFEQAGQSVTRQFGGLGLGLAISRSLVELHGGKIAASSPGRGKGAKFTVQLPLSVPEVQAQTLAASPQYTFRPLRILLVEDHGVTARMIRMVLTEKGHSVEMAGDVATALELAQGQAFDLLLSDLGLPDGSGHDLIRALRSRGYNLPGIALSGYGQEDDVRRSHEAGFSAHLTKPASREAIDQAVHSVMIENAHSNFTHSAQSDAPVFDAEKALERCYGQREMLQQMTSTFLNESDELLSQMRAALDRRNLAETGKAAHRLKGSLVYLGAEPAVDAASNLEQAARSNDMELVSKASRELEHQLKLLNDALINKS